MNIKIENWISEYESKYSLYESFCSKISNLLNDLAKSHGIKIHLVESRAKTLDSFSEKIQRRGKKYNYPLKELTDLAGIRIIVFYDKDIDKICDILNNEFDIDTKNSVDKRELLSHDKFGYNSVHKVISLDSNRIKLTEWKKYRDLKAEIQVRTVLQHAWSVISHALEYKNELEVPKLSRRKLSRLSGLLELADEQFEELRKSQLKEIEESKNLIKKNELTQDINLISVEYYIGLSPLVNKMVDNLNLKFRTDKGKFKYPSPNQERINKEHDNTMLSELISLCHHYGITTIDLLDNLIRNIDTSIEKYFAKLLLLHSYILFSVDLLLMIIIGSKIQSKSEFEELKKITFFLDDDLNNIFSVRAALQKIE